MPYSIRSSPFFQMENPALISLLRRKNNPTDNSKHSKKSSLGGSGGGGVFKMFKLIPMLSSGCKMVNLLSRQRKPLLKDHATTGTIFGYRKGRVFLAIQEDPHCLPMFIIELPMLTCALQKEMASEIVRIALESETKTAKKKLYEEFVWAVFCNGRKIGYSIRRKHMTDDEIYVIQALRGVSMGAGVLPGPENTAAAAATGTPAGDGEMTYMRARFERVVGSKDSEALYMINPEGSAQGTEFSIFFVRSR